MKLKFLAAAVPALLAAQAHAIAPSVTPAATLYVVGANALYSTLGAISESLFQPGTINVITDQSNGTPGVNYRSYYGTLKAGVAPSVGGSRNVLIVDRGQGGSYYGIAPVARSQSIPFQNVNSSCTAVAGAVYPNPTYVCTGTVNAVPQLGVSDQEPTLYSLGNVPSGSIDGFPNAALSPTELASLTIQPEYQVLLGVALTNNVGLTNLSKAQVAAILTGNYTDWSQLGLAAGPIILQSRGAGAGVLAGANAYFLNYPCAVGYQGNLSPAPAQGDGSTVFSVIANSTNPGIVTALDADYAAGKRAIGLLGLEYQPGASDHYQFVSINGAAPTQANAVNGTYDFFFTNSIQYRTATPAGPTLDLINAFIGGSTNPAVVLSTPGTALDPTLNSDSTYAAQTTLGTRFGNSCAPLQLFPYQF